MLFYILRQQLISQQKEDFSVRCWNLFGHFLGAPDERAAEYCMSNFCIMCVNPTHLTKDAGTKWFIPFSMILAEPVVTDSDKWDKMVKFHNSRLWFYQWHKRQLSKIQNKENMEMWLA